MKRFCLAYAASTKKDSFYLKGQRALVFSLGEPVEVENISIVFYPDKNAAKGDAALEVSKRWSNCDDLCLVEVDVIGLPAGKRTSGGKLVVTVTNCAVPGPFRPKGAKQHHAVFVPPPQTMPNESARHRAKRLKAAAFKRRKQGGKNAQKRQDSLREAAEAVRRAFDRQKATTLTVGDAA